MKNARIVFCFLLSSLSASAQILPAAKPAAPPATPPTSKDPLNRDSPQNSVVAFLEAAHAQNYRRAWRYLDLRKMPEDERLKGGAELAIKLEASWTGTLNLTWAI
jgi:hypothetical protein